MRPLQLFLTALLFPIFLITGCGKKDDIILSEKEMYDRAFHSLNTGRYEEAVNQYEALRSAYPYGRFTTQGNLEVCYAHYKVHDDGAVPCIIRFLNVHPTHPHIDYAYYLKGLAYMPIKPPQFGERFFRLQDQFTDYDAESAREAYAAFTEVIERFPFSQYAESSREILVDLVNTFARHDLRVAQFYLYRKAYVGAINRARSILERYQTSRHAEEALAVLIYAYEQLEMDDLVADNRRVLSHNFPDSKFLADSTAILDKEIVERQNKSFLFGLFK